MTATLIALCTTTCVGVLMAAGLLMAGDTLQTENIPGGNDISGQLAADAEITEIARHLLDARRQRKTSHALSMLFPDMTRQEAYDIQMLTMRDDECTDRRVGWKIGYTRVLDPQTPPDPVFGYVMGENVYRSGSIVSPSDHVNGTTFIEAEVAFWIKTDLPGPVVTREQMKAAVAGVGPAIELVGGRLYAAEGKTHTRNHDITDNVTQVGIVVSDRRYSLDQVDFSRVVGIVEINGEKKAEGPASSIMGKDPFEAMLWLANELPRYGRQLHAGDVVVSGTVVAPPPLRTGESARVVFSDLGTVDVKMAEK